jgi:SpoIIAA-like
VLVLRREGPQPKFDLAAIAKEVAHGQANAKLPRVLFDWSGVTIWPFEAPEATAIRYWYTLAPRVARAALIHDEKWDRHASMLTALMRAVGAQVKSFPPGYQERAVAWLEAPPAAGSGPKALRRYPADD